MMWKSFGSRQAYTFQRTRARTHTDKFRLFFCSNVISPIVLFRFNRENFPTLWYVKNFERTLNGVVHVNSVFMVFNKFFGVLFALFGSDLRWLLNDRIIEFSNAKHSLQMYSSRWQNSRLNFTFNFKQFWSNALHWCARLWVFY